MRDDGELPGKADVEKCIMHAPHGNGGMTCRHDISFTRQDFYAKGYLLRAVTCPINPSGSCRLDTLKDWKWVADRQCMDKGWDVED
jgi:hypothetical protein